MTTPPRRISTIQTLAMLAMLGSGLAVGSVSTEPEPEPAPRPRPRPTFGGRYVPQRREPPPREPTRAELLAIEKRKRKGEKRLAAEARRKAAR